MISFLREGHPYLGGASRTRVCSYGGLDTSSVVWVFADDDKGIRIYEVNSLFILIHNVTNQPHLIFTTRKISVHVILLIMHRVVLLLRSLVLGWVHMCVAVSMLLSLRVAIVETANSRVYGHDAHSETATTFRVICRDQEAQLYLHVFEKYSECYGGKSRGQDNVAFEGTSLPTSLCRGDFRQPELQTHVYTNIRKSYSSICVNNAAKRQVIHLSRSPTICLLHSVATNIRAVQNAHNQGSDS